MDKFSPAYDMNPTLNDYQSLLINASTSKSDMDILRNSCEELCCLPKPLTPLLQKSLKLLNHGGSLPSE